MRLIFPDIPCLNYRSASQRARVLSEMWMKNEMYCPSCGNDHLMKFPNNSRLADFFCDNCGEVYELKSKSSPFGKTILDGAYYAALERITSSTNPNLFVLHYHQNSVEDLTLVPKHFFTPDILRMRRALSSEARRAGYIGSVIMYSDISKRGKIPVIKSHAEISKSIVMQNYAHSVRLKVDNLNLRGWIMDVMRCIDRIASEIFSLEDMYCFADELSAKHTDNHNIEAKIRQQLQFLRNKGFIEFLGGGTYRKISYI